jgi:hypothetical protein
MYLKKEINISFFMITISASNLYLPMIWLYVFLLDFLILFLCDPDLQCVQASFSLNFLKKITQYMVFTLFVYLAVKLIDVKR